MYKDAQQAQQDQQKQAANQAGDKKNLRTQNKVRQ